MKTKTLDIKAVRIVNCYTGQEIDSDLVFDMYKELQELYNKAE